jgi:hypothetical protein
VLLFVECGYQPPPGLPFDSKPGSERFAKAYTCRRGIFAGSIRRNMKKLMVVCFALALLTFGVASAQDNMQNDSMKSDMPKTTDVKGKISQDGTKFVSDQDKKSWTIVNPEAVKGHEGHHVILTAHVYPDKNEVHVMSLKMVK